MDLILLRPEDCPGLSLLCPSPDSGLVPSGSSLVNAFCTSAALLKHKAWTCVQVHTQGRDRVLLERDFPKLFFHFPFSKMGLLRLRHQRTCAAPCYNWIHCEFKLSECSLSPVCICMNAPSAHTYKLMQYAMKKSEWIQSNGVVGL